VENLKIRDVLLIISHLKVGDITQKKQYNLLRNASDTASELIWRRIPEKTT